MDVLPARIDFRVICGPTGSGKSRLLRILAAQGAHVLDLEKLASHMGSVLGNFPSERQPTQTTFESAVWRRSDCLTETSLFLLNARAKRSETCTCRTR
jgi:tRNA 2-selenouridine synthase SelU